MRRCLFPFVLLLAGNPCWAQKFLSHREAIADIDFYTRTMTASHYAPFMYISPDDYDARVGEIKNTIGDSIAIRDFVFLFYKVTALLNDAHSTPQLGQPVFQDEYKKEQFFPYKLVSEKQRIYAPVKLANDLGIPVGAEIITINGAHMGALSAQVQRGIAGLPSFREAASDRLISYFLFLKGIQPPFVLTYKDKSGSIQKATVRTGVSFKKALSASMPHIIKPYDHEILPNKLGYIDVLSLSGDTAHFRSFLDTCFSNFSRANIRYLAIDLRKNSGGNTDLGDLLFSYLTNKKYTWGRKHWKVSEVYKDYLRVDGDSTSRYVTVPDGTVLNEDSCSPKENPFTSNFKFSGKIFFITGPFTFSSAMAVADVVKTYKLGTIIGTATGENTRDFGEAFAIELPHSKIKIQSTTSLSDGANCHKAKNGPVLPDIVVRNKLQDEVLEKDKVLEYLLNNIK